MKIIDGNKFALRGAAGEIATVTVTAQGTRFLVAYRVQGGEVIDGPANGSMTEGSPLRFKLVANDSGRNKLSLGFTFASPASVSGQPDDEIIEYEVRVTGNEPNSDTSHEFVSGSFDIPTDNRQWRFAVV